jgi:hypothetical protein
MPARRVRWIQPSTRALGWLTMAHSRQRIRRSLARIMTPRRLVLTSLAISLAVLWFGQILAAGFMRPPAGPGRIADFFAWGMTAYLLWHLLRSAWQPPEEPIAWSNAEREWLLAAPLSRWQLIVYRLHTTVGSAVCKAGIATLLLFADLPQPWLGFFALFGGLLGLELFRMVVEVCLSQVTAQTRRGFLIVTSSAAIALLCLFLNGLWLAWDPARPGLRGLLNAVTEGGVATGRSPLVQTVRQWFVPWANLANASSVSWPVMGWATIGLLQLAALVLSVKFLDQWFARCSLIRMRWLDRSAVSPDRGLAEQRLIWSNVHMPWRIRADGIVPLVWRQSLWLRQYWLPTVGAMAVPSALCALPLWVLPSNVPALPFVVGNLAFYTLLLSPAAIKSDFRRDLDRLAFLKSLPIASWRIVCGQVLTPLMISTVGHALVLALAWGSGAANLAHVLIALAFLLPFSIMAFAAENAAFLCFPYRLNQEGFEILVRTTLSFTAKGIAFSVLIGILWVWSRAVSQLDGSSALFYSGIVGGMAAGAAVAVWLCTLAFDRFDPSADVPAP